MTVMLIWVIAPTPTTSTSTATAAVSDDAVAQIVETHCAACHAETPSQPGFQSAPAGIRLDNLSLLADHSGKVLQAAVDTHYMPLGNMTGMTEEERGQLGAWLSNQ